MNQSNKFEHFYAELPYKGIYQNGKNTTFMHTSEMGYIKYEVNFVPLFYVQNIKISVYVEYLHNFNFSF